MKQVVRAGIAACAFTLAAPAFAQTDMSALTEGQKRRVHLPYVRAATDCIARSILAAPEATRLARIGQWNDAVFAGPKNYCQSEISALVGTHDQLYGAGTGQPFFIGPYFSDLARALGTRLRPEFERLAAADARAEAVRLQAIARQEAEKREQIDQAQRAFTLLLNKMYECTDAQVVSLIASAETADVLATAAMTVCNKEVNRAVEAAEAKTRLVSPGSYDGSLRSELQGAVRKRVITTAVQAKAALNAPRPMTPPQPSPVVPTAIAPSVTLPPEPAAPATKTTAITDCLRTIAKAREEKFVKRDDLVKAMLDLCRPEIEASARSVFLKDDKAPLDQLREKALETALSEARVIVGAAN